MSAPIIVKLGRQKRKLIKALRDGDPEVVEAILAELRASGDLGDGPVPALFVIEKDTAVTLRDLNDL